MSAFSTALSATSPATETDVRKTFERIRKEREAGQQPPAADRSAKFNREKKSLESREVDC